MISKSSSRPGERLALSASLIAEHACRKYSGRIGRTKDAKAFSPEAIDLAVHAHVRHRQTDYDQLLARGHERQDARALVTSDVRNVLETWRLGH
jgi:hypothetical protein